MRACNHGCDVMLCEKYFIKAIEDSFRVYMASSKHEGSWENFRKYVEGLHNCLNFSQPPSHLDEAYINMEKVVHTICFTRARS